MRTSTIFLTACAAAILLILSCGGMKDNAVTPPLENVDVPFETYKVKPDQEQTLELPGGGSLMIPANAFVDKNGDPVKSDVSISFREFHDAATILASGIPMTYDSAGQSGNFQTAGMFEIRGTDGKDEVFIAPGKNLTVNLASPDGGSDYNLYQLDQEGNWSYLNVSEPEFNPVNKEIEEKLSKLPPPPMKPQEFKDDMPVFDMQFDPKDHPELDAFTNIVWQYAGEKGNKETDISLNEWIWQTTWSSVGLERTETAGVYMLTLTSADKKFSTLITPALKGNDYKNAMKLFEENMKQYETVMKEKADLEQMRNNQRAFLRTANISSFGIYNCDKLYNPGPEAFAVKGSFLFDDAAGKVPDDAPVYLITGNSRAVITLKASYDATIAWDPQDKSQIVAFLPGNRIATFSNARFKSLSEVIQPGREHVFELKTQSGNISNIEQLVSSMAD